MCDTNFGPPSICHCMKGWAGRDCDVSDHGWVDLSVIGVKPTLGPQVSVTFVTLVGLDQTVIPVIIVGQMFPVTLVTQTLGLQDSVILV